MARSKDSTRDETLGEALLGLRTASREVESNPTRRRILDGAAAAFAERGYQGATTRELARAAGVTEKTLYAHFRSKAELFVAAMGPGLLDLMGGAVFEDLLPELLASGSTRGRLLAILRNRLRFARQRPGLMKSVVQEALLSPHFREELRRYWAEHLLPPARKMVETAIAAGEVREVEPDRLIRTLVSVAIGYVLTRHVLLPEREWDDDAEAEAMVDLLMSGFAASHT